MRRFPLVEAGSKTGYVGANRRQRIQKRALREILDAAREELRINGPSGVTMRAVAKAVDMTPSGLYRHVSGRDELLGLVAADAYAAIGETMRQARDRAPAGDHATAWYLTVMAMRQWYLTHLPEYQLLASPRVIQSPPDELRITGGRNFSVLARICEDAIADRQIDLESAMFATTSAPAEGDLSAAARSLTMTGMAMISGHIGFETRGMFGPVVMDLQEYFGKSVRGVMRLMGFVTEPGPLVMADLG